MNQESQANWIQLGEEQPKKNDVRSPQIQIWNAAIVAESAAAWEEAAMPSMIFSLGLPEFFVSRQDTSVKSILRVTQSLTQKK